jgi:hypothetical protein
VISLYFGPICIGVLGVVGDNTVVVESVIGLVLLLSEAELLMVESTNVVMVLLLYYAKKIIS